MSELRRRMDEDMIVRGMADRTREAYLWAVEGLARFYRELLAISYFHVVFTLPHSLNALAQGNPRVIYTLLFRATAFWVACGRSTGSCMRSGPSPAPSKSSAIWVATRIESPCRMIGSSTTVTAASDSAGKTTPTTTA
jgi:hypothetical protein